MFWWPVIAPVAVPANVVAVDLTSLPGARGSGEHGAVGDALLFRAAAISELRDGYAAFRIERAERSDRGWGVYVGDGVDGVSDSGDGDNRDAAFAAKSTGANARHGCGTSVIRVFPGLRIETRGSQTFLKQSQKQTRGPFASLRMTPPGLGFGGED